jgi:hypothetical protein
MGAGLFLQSLAVLSSHVRLELQAFVSDERLGSALQSPGITQNVGEHTRDR